MKKSLKIVNDKGISRTINVGDTVIALKEYCYAKYTKFCLFHPKYAIKFAYMDFPIRSPIHKVIGIHRHVEKDRYNDGSRYVIVIQNKETRQIYFMAERGVHCYNRTII